MSTQIARKEVIQIPQPDPEELDLAEEEPDVVPPSSQTVITPQREPSIAETPSTSTSSSKRKKPKTVEDFNMLHDFQQRTDISKEIQDKISKMIESSNPRALTQKGWCTWLEGRMSDMHPKLMNEFYDRTYTVCQDIISRSEILRDNEASATTSATTQSSAQTTTTRTDKTFHDMQPPSQTQPTQITSYMLPSRSGFEQQPDSNVQQVCTDSFTASGQLAWDSAGPAPPSTGDQFTEQSPSSSFASSNTSMCTSFLQSLPNINIPQ